MFPHGETVTLLAPTQVADPYSDETTDDWTTPVETPLPGVAVEPRPSPEGTQDARNSVVYGYTIYDPSSTTIDPRHRIRVRGEEFAVDGMPAVWQDPYTGWAPGQVIQTKRTDG